MPITVVYLRLSMLQEVRLHILKFSIVVDGLAYSEVSVEGPAGMEVSGHQLQF